MGLRDGSLPVLNAGELGQEFASASGNRDGCLEPAGENSVLEGQNTYNSWCLCQGSASNAIS